MQFYTKWIRPERVGKKYPVSMTETSYMPAKAQIENLIAAGKRLVEYRKEMFDFSTEKEINDEFIDVTRRPGVDIVEIEMAERAISARKRSKLEEQERIQKEEQKRSEDKKEFDKTDEEGKKE